jgi:dTDP-4-dehydrorhamnose 3,5-epimerase
MKLFSFEIDGPKKIIAEPLNDSRGSLFKPYSSIELAEAGIKFEVKEVIYSVSWAGVIRGMHFQTPPFEQQKLVSVISGEILDVILDLRLDSSTYGKSISVKISADKPEYIYVPAGFAHGFKAMADATTVLYMLSKQHFPQHEGGVRFDSFKFDWEFKNPILSARDLSFENFDEFKSPFGRKEE